jgi:hypothetical protein
VTILDTYTVTRAALAFTKLVALLSIDPRVTGSDACSSAEVEQLAGDLGDKGLAPAVYWALMKATVDWECGNEAPWLLKLLKPMTFSAVTIPGAPSRPRKGGADIERLVGWYYRAKIQQPQTSIRSLAAEAGVARATVRNGVAEVDRLIKLVDVLDPTVDR